jgi:hypothetical protein
MTGNSTDVPYRKLTRLHRGIGLMTQVWLGPDHLLHVTSTGYTENYRRFYLRDIQAMQIVHTARRTIIAVVLAALLLLVVIIVTEANGGWVGCSVAATIFLPFLMWNHLIGQGCRVVVVSAVQQETMRSFSRLPKTRRLLAELKPLIEAAQAGLNSVKVAPVAVDSPAPAPLSPPLLPTAPPPLPPPLPRA